MRAYKGFGQNGLNTRLAMHAGERLTWIRVIDSVRARSKGTRHFALSIYLDFTCLL